MSCVKCGSGLLMQVDAKCGDSCSIVMNDEDIDDGGYVPHNLNIGGGKYITFTVCTNCGYMVGSWPLKK